MPRLEDRNLIIIKQDLPQPQSRRTLLPTGPLPSTTIVTPTTLALVVIAIGPRARLRLLVNISSTVTLRIRIIIIAILIVVALHSFVYPKWVFPRLCLLGWPSLNTGVSTVLKDLEAFTCNAHVAQFDFWSQSHDIHELQRELSWVDVRSVYVIRKERNAKTAEMWY